MVQFPSHLTCITFYSGPPRLTCGTRSTLYVTRVVFTVGGTGNVTVTTVDTGIITTCFIQISSTRLKRAKCNNYNIGKIYRRGIANACDLISYLGFFFNISLYIENNNIKIFMFSNAAQIHCS